MQSKKSDHATEIQRFIESLNQAMVMHQISQRKLGDEMGVSIGTITKYLRGEVNPFDVRTRITRNLSRLLGVTPDALFDYYDTGEYQNTLTIKDVESWIRSASETKDLPRILAALSASQKNIQKQEPDTKFVKEAKQKYKKWLMGDDVKRFTKAGASKFAKTVEQLFQEECERRQLSKEEAIRDLTPYLQKYFHMEYWGVIIQRLSAGEPIPETPEAMKAVYEAHDKICPCIATFHEWICSEGHENCDRVKDLETCIADAAVPA